MSKPKAKPRVNNGPVIALIIGGLALLGLLGYAAIMSTKAKPPVPPDKLTPNQYNCTSSPVHVSIPGLEFSTCKGSTHVPDGQKVNYDTDPPLSGDHWAVPTAPGFYTVAQTPERLVHALEHGNVVIYYDPAKLPAADLEPLKALAKQYAGQWDGIVVVPRTDAKNPLILTAWENALRLPGYDKAKVDQFVDAFRGRGPENPVRPLP
ncbi:MAG: hypothetical protein JWN15_2254 [Firmicutes bacterium]|nr:hypothetical protein [Bacillota bacterium]